MPEGDTIHKLARSLGPSLLGRRLERVTLRDRPGAAELEGRRVVEVRAIGKHLLIVTEDGSALRSHLGMDGRWHRYRPGEPWRRPPHAARIVLATDAAVLACFEPPQVEVFRWQDRGRHPVLAALGPDLVEGPLEAGVAARRARARSHTRDARERQIAEVLLDQGVAAGIGNVYKSELLHLARLDPWAPLSAVSDEELEAIYRRASELLRRNVHTARRETMPPHLIEGPLRARGRGLWVYGRTRKPCRNCGRPVEQARQGEEARLTYFCPSCQPRR